MTSTPATKKRVLSGMRPTGKLHLGNYVGALQNWVRMQEQYDCFFVIVDWHALTTDYGDTSRLKENLVDVLLDWLAAGLDPEKCVMFIQSHVPAHAELHLLLSMITPLGWLERVPTYKEQKENLKEKDLNTYGFLGYPVLQSADILLYKADVVPVGEDQVAHVELTREIARRFNAFYAYAHPLVVETNHLTPDQKKVLNSNGTKITPDTDYIFPRVVFPEPQALLTPAPRLPGTDGRKMSKSYHNTIDLADDEEATTKKIRSAITDPQKVRRNDPGNPDICPVFALHHLCNAARTETIAAECRSGALGCVACKGELAETMNAWLRPVRARRASFDRATIARIVADGTERARVVASATLADVKRALRLI